MNNKNKNNHNNPTVMWAQQQQQQQQSNNDDDGTDDIRIPSPSVITTTTSATTTTATSPSPVVVRNRRIAKSEIYPRLPVWPVWMGVILFFIGRINRNWAASLEDVVGGRVCPMDFFQDTRSSPFLLLVHHHHAFWAWDFIVRPIQRNFILPEGFPAHPHRGFTTLTYFTKGGFTHRDSMGVRQRYGAAAAATNNKKNNNNNSNNNCQWLFTGAGVLHEEMFDLSFGTDHELFQLWVNVPAAHKMDPPRVGTYEAPSVREEDDGCETIVLAGSYYSTTLKHNNNNNHNNKERVFASSPASPVFGENIYHVKLDAGGVWRYECGGGDDDDDDNKDNNNDNMSTVMIYVRSGSIMIDGTEAPVHSMITLEEAYGRDTATSVIELVNSSSKKAADCLVLMGNPYVGEPVAAQGSMVMNYQDEIQQAYRDYQMGRMGLPWSHELTDEEWKEHVQANPNMYKYDAVLEEKDQDY